MSTTLKFKRGNTSAAGSFLGAEGELYINTDTDQIHVHDGATTGGAAVMARVNNTTFTGNTTIDGSLIVNGISANGTKGTAGQVLASNGTSTYWAVQGNSTPVIGEIKYSDVLPTNGTWLETGKYYSKSTYPDLAAAIGDIPDIGPPLDIPNVKLPAPILPYFVGPSSGTPRYLTATNGANTVVTGGIGGRIMVSLDKGANWTSVPSTANGDISEVKFLNNKFWAVGGVGTILNSDDGITWNFQYSPMVPASGYINSITYGGGIYVAATQAGAQSALLYSTDGKTWKSISGFASISALMTRVVYGNGVFVAVATNGSIFTSTDGFSWTSRTSGTTGVIFDVIYAGGTFVAYGQSTGGTGTYVATSSDGTSWTTQTVTGASYPVLGMAYGNSTFVAAGQYGQISKSSDAVTWTTPVAGNTALANNTSQVTAVWTGNKFVVAGGNLGKYSTSTDNGATWTAYTDPELMPIAAVNPTTDGGFMLSGNTAVVHVANNGTRSVIGASTWNYTITLTLNKDIPVSYNGSNTYVCVGNNTIMSSSDGVSWTPRNVPQVYGLNQSYYAGGRFYAGGSAAGIITSTDGITWTRCTTAGHPAEVATMYDLTYGTNGTLSYWIACMSTGVYYSTDGTTFTAVGTTITTGYSVTYADGYFVIAASLAIYYVAIAGVTSTWSSAAISGQGYRVRFLNNRWIVCGSAATYYTTTASIGGWSSYALTAMWDVTYNSSSGTYVFVGNNGVIYSTPESNFFTSVSTRSPLAAGCNFNNIYWTGTYYIATNLNSTIYPYIYSTDLTTWTVGSTAGPVNNLYLTAYVNGKLFSITSSIPQVSSDGINWTPFSNVRSIANITNYMRKVNGIYYWVNSGANFYSTDGINWNWISEFAYAPARISHNGTKFGAFIKPAGYAPGQFWTSSNGTSWSRGPDVAQSNAMMSVNFGLAATADLAGVNGNWVLYLNGSAYQAEWPSIMMVSNNDGSSWSASHNGMANTTQVGMLASNGSAVVASYGGGATYGGSFKSTDGINWTPLASWTSGLSVGPSYQDGTWYVHNSQTSDLDTIKQTNLNNPLWFPYGDWIYTIDITGQVYICHKKGTGPVMIPPQQSRRRWARYSTGLFHCPAIVTEANTVLIPVSVTAGWFSTYPYVECNLFSYDTNTTFFVPPTNHFSSGAASYIFAG